MMRSKKGLELQVSYVVILILSIAALAIGLAFAAKLFTKANDLQASLDSQTEIEIQRALDSGQKVAIPINKKDIPRNKFDKFGVGVFNTLPADATTFKVYVTFSEFFYKTTNEPARCDGGKAPMTTDTPGSCSDTFYPVDEMVQALGEPKPALHAMVITVSAMKPNDKSTQIVGITVPPKAASGTYVFDVVVKSVAQGTSIEEPYGTKQKFYVKVP